MGFGRGAGGRGRTLGVYLLGREGTVSKAMGGVGWVGGIVCGFIPWEISSRGGLHA